MPVNELLRTAAHAAHLGELVLLIQREAKEDMGLAPDLDAWQLEEDEFEQWYARLYAAYQERGIRVEYGHCPRGLAEKARIDAEEALIVAARPFFGLSSGNLSPSDRQCYLAQLVKLATTAPVSTHSPSRSLSLV
jgi:hypothetical protein